MTFQNETKMKSFPIENIQAKPAIEYDGIPSIEIEVLLSDGSLGSARERLNGIDISTAIATVNEKIVGELVGEDASRQFQIDSLLKEIDGTTDFSHLGKSIIFPISMAVSRAAATSAGLSLYQYLGGVRSIYLPTPLFTALSGRKNDQRWDIFIFSANNKDLSKGIENCRLALESIKSQTSITSYTEDCERAFKTIKKLLTESLDFTDINVGILRKEGNNEPDQYKEKGRINENFNLLIKDNDILSTYCYGTVSDMFTYTRKFFGRPMIIKPNSGFHGSETFATDFAVAIQADYLKLESFTDWTTLHHLNRLLSIGSDLLLVNDVL